MYVSMTIWIVGIEYRYKWYIMHVEQGGYKIDGEDS